MGNCCGSRKPIPETRSIYPATTVHFDEYGKPFNPNGQFANNRIRTTKYSLWSFLPLNLWEQFHRFANVYFVFILILNFMPGINAFAKEVAPIPIIITLSVIAVKDAYEDFRRHLSDRKVNRRTCEVFSVERSRYVDNRWEQILPGDFVRLHTNEMIPADILLLHSSNIAGICHIETSNLDGESNLKQREVADRGFNRQPFSPFDFTFPVEVESPSPELYKFNGKIVRMDDIVPILKNNMILRGCVLRNTDYIEGMVIYAGCETKAALNNTGPRFKRSKLEQRINFDVAWCVLILAAICFTGAVGSGIWQDNLPGDDVLFVALDRNSTTSSPAFQGFLNFWRFIIIFQSIIPLPLYVSIEFIKMHQVWHMSHDLQLYDAHVDRRVEVRTFDILEDLGQIEYVFCDKTGTLTENKMEFKRASINGVEYTADTVHNCVNHRTSHTSEETLVPQPDRSFASLRPVVSRMTLLSQSPLAAGEELHLTGQGMPTSVAGDGRTECRLNNAFEEDFILAMTICNTVVVSATKNTATLFQAPTRRKGIRDIFRINPRRRSPNRKLLKRPLMDTISTKHSLSLGSLFCRRQRPLKPDSTVVPRFEIHDEDDEKGEERITAETTDVDLEALSNGLATGATVVNDTSSADTQPVAVPELAATDASHRQPAEGDAIPVSSTLPRIQTLPPLVPGLILDLPTPSALQRQGSSTIRKSASTTEGMHWLGSDLDESTEEPESGSCASLESPDTQRLHASGAEIEPAHADLADTRQLSTRTLTVVAHDGSSYELPVSKDFVPDTGTCPLSDAVLLSSYESESPDEIALVKEACSQGCKLLQRGLDFVLLWLPADGLVGMRVLHILPFDSMRKRMSILVRHPATNEAILYTKGADSAILDRIHCSSEEDARRLSVTRMHVDNFSRAGLRTLVFAKRVIPEDELKRWSREYIVAEATASSSTHHLMNRLERKFTLLGATGIEDRLQPGVPETIEHLREAGMHVWVLTGDKQETAVNVAHSARLITDEHRLMFINATSKIRTGYLINCHLHSILCGHSLPKFDEINDVVSDDPDIESTSSSSSTPIGSDTESEHPYPPPVIAHMNARHVQLCSPDCRANSSLRRGRLVERGRRRITRSVSETRHTYKRRRRRRRVVRRHPMRTQPRSTASLKASKLALIIDGETLQFALEEDMRASFLRLARLCSSVLCCRSTPSQKADVVKLVKDGLRVQTLAIGDGANDVNMIQVANVGVGISGEEGMQAVLASDFAISRFRFLERLVIVHGHLCYDKLAHTALYLFYKDAVYIFLLFWFQLFNGFSGSNAIDQLSQILFSITFTGLPPFLMGIWDNPVDADTLMANPLLYRTGIEGKAYRPWMFWVNILDALWQTLIIFFIPYLFYADSTMTIWRFGVLQMNILVLCSLLHAALETRTWVLFHWLGLLTSYFVLWMFFNMIYHSLAVTGVRPENPYRVIFVAMHDGPFWLLSLVSVFAALLPRLLFIALNNTLTPSLDTVACLLSKVYGRGKRLPLQPYLFGSVEDTPYPFERRPFARMPQPRFSDASLSSTRTGAHVVADGPVTPPPIDLEAACIETPVHFRARVVQLLSVSGRLFRGAPSTSRIQPVNLPISPISLINLRRPSHLISDVRRRRRPSQTLDYSFDRSDQSSALVRVPSNANNFDDAIGLASTHAIWPAADPNVRAHSLSIGRHPRGRSRPRLESKLFQNTAPI